MASKFVIEGGDLQLSPTESSCYLHIPADWDILIITVLHKSDGTWYAILYAANTTFAIPLTLEGQASLHMIFILSWGTYLPATFY